MADVRWSLVLVTAPTTEPLTLAEVKSHCRIDSTSLADDLAPVQSIAPASQAIAASYGLVGTSVNVAGVSVLVLLESGTNGSGGTVDVKLQDSDDDATFADVTSGAFTQVTTANDNAIQEKEYTGGKTYLRAVATVAGAACVFGVTVVKKQATTAEDDLLNSLITAARQYVEETTGRALITQTWDLYLDRFPAGAAITIPRPDLQSITSLKYTDSAGAQTTWAASNYIADIRSLPGRLVLGYNISWPSVTLYPSNPVVIRFVAGYGAASAVPKAIKQAMLMLIAYWYANRESVIVGMTSKELEFATSRLLDPYRTFWF